MSVGKRSQSGLMQKAGEKTNKVRSSGIILVKQCCMTTDELNEAMDSLVRLSKEKVQGRVFLGECLSRTKELVGSSKKRS